MQTETPNAIPGSWIAEFVGDDMVVYPFGDKEEHELTDEECVCEPAVELVEGTGVRMLTHNAFDGRE